MTQFAVRGPNRRSGTVVLTSGGTCTVEFHAQHCNGCPGHCAMRLFGADTRRLVMQMHDGSAPPDAGSRVWVAVAERAILRAAMGLFGLPLVGMVAGSGVASALGMTEPAAAGMAAAGLAAGLIAGALAIRRAAPPGATLHDGYAERGVTLLNEAASMRSEARTDFFNMGKTRIT